MTQPLGTLVSLLYNEENNVYRRQTLLITCLIVTLIFFLINRILFLVIALAKTKQNLSSSIPWQKER